MKRKKTDCGIALFCDVPKIRRVVVESQRGEKAFIEEITRINYEREMAKRNVTARPIRGFFDAEVSA